MHSGTAEWVSLDSKKSDENEALRLQLEQNCLLLALYVLMCFIEREQERIGDAFTVFETDKTDKIVLFSDLHEAVTKLRETVKSADAAHLQAEDINGFRKALDQYLHEAALISSSIRRSLVNVLITALSYLFVIGFFYDIRKQSTSASNWKKQKENPVRQVSGIDFFSSKEKLEARTLTVLNTNNRPLIVNDFEDYRNAKIAVRK